MLETLAVVHPVLLSEGHPPSSLSAIPRIAALQSSQEARHCEASQSAYLDKLLLPPWIVTEPFSALHKLHPVSRGIDTVHRALACQEKDHQGS